jgi:hypothetical protein
MSINRRDMMTSAAAFALLMADTEKEAFAEALREAPRENEVDVTNYWTNFYDHVEPGVGTRGKKGLAKSDRKTLYLHCPDSLGTLNYADNLSRDTLPDIQGDVLVKMAVSQFRPAKGDISTDITHLRIDASQSFDYMNLVAPLSWAAIASITPGTAVSKLPTIDQLGFAAQAKAASDSTNLKQITLTSGVGQFAVNVTRPANPTFTKIVQSASVGVSAVLSMMTLPAISVPAVKVFSELFGKCSRALRSS